MLRRENLAFVFPVLGWHHDLNPDVKSYLGGRVADWAIAREKIQKVGSGCISVGSAVAPDTRDSGFESQLRQNFIHQLHS